MASMSRRTVLAGAAGAGGLAVTAGAAACAQPDAASGPEARRRVYVVGHRGASGHRPEHTSASYELAARWGVDAVDVDLCATRDGALVARHEPEIGRTTDVATRPEFANRRSTRVIDGTSYDGWFTSDFTLAELTTLRAVERIPGTRPHNTVYDGRYPVLALDEVLDLLDRVSAELGRPVGILPEVKHSTYHRAIGLPVEPALVETLRRRGRDRPDSNVIIQSFEVANLRSLKGQVGCPLLQLVDSTGAAPADFVAAGDRRTFDDLVTPAGLREVATYATWIGPSKERVLAGTTPTTLVADARAVGLRTMPYTFRNENEFLPEPLRRPGPPGTPVPPPASTYGDAFGEYAALYGSGVEGVFSDNGDTAIASLVE